MGTITQFPILTQTFAGIGLPYSPNDPAYGSIQAAINAASAAGGGTVLIPPGTFSVSSPITLSSNVYLVGSGRGVSTIKLASSLASDFIQVVSHDLWGISNLTIDVNNNITGQNGAIGTQNCNDLIIDLVEIKHITMFGINLNGASRFRVTRCKVSKDSTANTQNQGILVAASLPANDGFINNNVLMNTAFDLSCVDTTISDNVVSGFGFGCGITMEQSVNCARNVITRNRVTGGVGIDVNATAAGGIESWCPDTVISNNIFYGNAGGGITAVGKNSTVVGNICFDNCTIQPGTGAGITAGFGNSTYNASNSVFANNQSFNTAGAAGPQSYGYKETGSDGQQPGIILKGNNFSTNATGQTFIVNSTTINDWPNVGTYNPTVSPSAGSLTAYTATGNYQVFGKQVYLSVTVNITTNGTASGFLTVDLPFVANSSATIEWSISGYCPNSNKSLGGFLVAGGTTFQLRNFDGTYPGADGFSLNVSGFYYTN